MARTIINNKQVFQSYVLTRGITNIYYKCYSKTVFLQKYT